MQQYFRVSPPSVHQMVLTLERSGFIRRQPGVARSIEMLVDPEHLPGTTDGDAIRQAMENLGSYDGLIKTYKQPFTADRHDALGADDYVIVHYDGNDIHPVN